MRRAITSTRRLAIAGALALAALGAALAAPAPRPVAAAPVPGDAGAALDWVVHELAAGGHRLDHLGQTDWGLTADAALAAIAGGRTADGDVASTIDQLLGHLDEYSTWNDLGAAFAGVRLAGPSAKTLLVALLAGRQGTDVDGLAQTVRSLVVTSGDEAGRVADQNPHGPDSSNGFSQAYGILALARTPSGAPSSTVDYLLHQQCPAGGFRLTYQPGGCTADAAIDTDASAVAVEALLAVPRTAAVTEGLRRAVAWMLATQDPATGSFGGTGPTASPNANSTALFAQVLRGAGRTAAADRATAWVAGLQLTPADAGAASADVGAVAYDPAALAAAETGGVGALARDQWRRSTSQGVFAFGLPVLGSVGGAAPEPVDDVPPATTTTAVAPSTTGVTTTTTTPSTTSVPSTSTSVPSTTLSTTTTIPVASVLGVTADRTSSAARVGTTPGDPSASLARTGSDASRTAALGVALLIAGALLAAAARPRRRS